jgi:hypothetical protein
MSFGEDQSRIRKGNAPENMAIIRHTALNMLQKAKQNKKDSLSSDFANWLVGKTASLNSFCQLDFNETALLFVLWLSQSYQFHI